MIYLDNAATTAVRGEVLEAMLPYYKSAYGNPSSIHGIGREARKAVEQARREVACAIGATPREIYFTAGGSESDNWALRGCAPRGKHIVTTRIEHHAVLQSCQYLEKNGYEVTYLPVDETGLVDPEAVRRAIRPDTALISVMTANNEIGTVEPISEIGLIAKTAGVAFHTDAVQAVGAIPIDVNALNADLLSISAHKLHGPKGVGALYIRSGTRTNNLIFGGAQERGLRAGTENVPAIVGMGCAVTLATQELPMDQERVSRLRDMLIQGILERIPDCRLNGHPAKRLPGNVNIAFDRVDGEAVLIHLDLAGFAVSSGSACASGSPDPSHVLLALGLSEERARGSLRFSLGRDNTEGDVNALLSVLPPIITKLRALRA